MTLQLEVHFNKKKYALPFHNFKKIVSFDQLGFWALILNNGLWD